MRTAVASLAVLSVLSATRGYAMDSHGMDDGLWSNLDVLKRGDRIGVIQTDQKRVEGRFDNVTDTAVTLQADQLVTVAKGNVLRVYRRGGSRRVTRTLIGGAIGLAAGAILSATVGERFRNEGQDAPAGVWIGGGAAIGAGIGALSSGGYKTIYRQPSPGH